MGRVFHARRALTRRLALFSAIAVATLGVVAATPSPASADVGVVNLNVEPLSNTWNNAEEFDPHLFAAGTLTISASGTWGYGTGSVGPGGNPSVPVDGTFLAPAAPAYALLVRFDTMSAWTVVGTGPTAITGSGSVHFAMNDRTGEFLDDTGSLAVSISIDGPAIRHTGYYSLSAGGAPITTPVLAGATIHYVGTMTNVGSANATTNRFELDAGANQYTWSLNTPMPTFSWSGPTQSSSCYVSRSDYGSFTTFYPYCETMEELAPGQQITLSGTFSTAGAKPRTENAFPDEYWVGSNSIRTWSNPSVVALPRIDGLLIDIQADSTTVVTGTPVHFTSRLTNTSTTQTLTNITDFGHVNMGYASSIPVGCTLSVSGLDATCGPFSLSPGASVVGLSTIETTGLVNQSIEYSNYATIAEIGTTYIADNSEFPVIDVVAPPDGPTVTLKPPTGFVEGATIELPTKFTTSAIPMSGRTITSVTYALDGSPVSASTVKPWTITVDPSTLSVGTHDLTVTATDSTSAVGFDTILFQVGAASISLGPSPLGPVTPAVTPGDGIRNGWSIPVINDSDVTARQVQLVVDASDSNGPVPFDSLAMLRGCARGVTPTMTCNLGDIAPHTTVIVPALIATNDLTGGGNVTGSASATASNVDSVAPLTLSAWQLVVPQDGVAEVISVLSASTPKSATLVNTVDPVSADNPQAIKFAIPRRVTSASIAGGAVVQAAYSVATATTASSKTVAPPPIAVQLLPDDPTNDDAALCPQTCLGKIARVVGDFSKYNDRLHPIKVTISTFIAGDLSITPGELVMKKDDGTITVLSGLAGRPCVKTGTGATATYNTPCLKTSKIAPVKATATGPAGIKVTDQIYFVGADPSFARR